MIVYIDQLFAINFAADFIILHIACGFSCERKLKFTLLAAVFGGLYGACMYLPRVGVLYHPIFKMLSAAVMVMIASRPKTISAFLRSQLTFASVASIAGGGVLAVLLMLGYSISEIAHNSISVFNAPMIVLLLILCGAVFAGKLCFAALKRGADMNRKIVKLSIFTCGRKITVSGLIDTGCSLRNPSGQEPVIIVNYRCVKDIIRQTDRVCIIPYSTVSGSGSFLGFRPDFIEIDGRKFKRVVVAVCYSEKTRGKMYSAIINSDILKEEAGIA